MTGRSLKAVRQVFWKPVRRSAGISRSWLPRTRSRSPGHSARSSTRRSSRQASGWATSPRQMTVSPAPTRHLQFRSRCRSSPPLPNGRPQPSSTEGSDRCRSDQQLDEDVLRGRDPWSILACSEPRSRPGCRSTLNEINKRGGLHDRWRFRTIDSGRGGYSAHRAAVGGPADSEFTAPGADATGPCLAHLYQD